MRLPFKPTRPSLSSGNACAWKADLVRVNGFDEAYEGWGQEDDDLGRRLYMAGVRPVPLLTEALATHLHHDPRHGDWGEGANLARYRVRPASHRCERGLSDHPHPDVSVVLRAAEAFA
jgi:GT2 family glycosyltransferase